jgi:hypothetical protein
MEINLNSPYEAVLIERRTKTIEKITVRSIIDFPAEKRVVAQIREIGEPVVLWSGDAYDAIGQWTDTDVQNRLNEIYNSPAQ